MRLGLINKTYHDVIVYQTMFRPIMHHNILYVVADLEKLRARLNLSMPSICYRKKFQSFKLHDNFIVFHCEFVEEPKRLGRVAGR
jgi:hypothetical protein